ncbi:AAA family ATPase [Streptomyces sp. NPDC048172]|uniref:AAA family ATPase n=1 Tax=Streptomyces sp. NPDC048172 TaxID=3365505 RepID=UPI0037184491
MDKLFEREDEEKTLAQLCTESSMGHVRIAAIGGPLASGKTALLDSLRHAAADAGATVIEATATSFESCQPLGAMDQLLRGRTYLSGSAQREARALVESAGGAGAHSEISSPVLDMLHGTLRTLTSGPLLVICIDDAHFMDVESLQYLLALTRRMGDSPILLALAYCPGMGRESVLRLLQADVLRRSTCTQLGLEPLSEAGVERLLVEYFHTETARLIAPECGRLSGGRPLLVHALAEDNADRVALSSAPYRPVAGPAFGRAVLSCLYRAEPVVLEIAQAMSALDEYCSTALVARLCGTDQETVSRVVASPGVGGLLDRELLCLPSVREAVLGNMPLRDRKAMRYRAARLLHYGGAPALVTADHLMRVDQSVPWAPQVLRDAADQALAGGSHELAIRYLERAFQECADQRERTGIAVRLTDIMCRFDPVGAGRYLPELGVAAEQGRLSARQLVTVVRSLLWNGHVEQATRVVARLDGMHAKAADGRGDDGTAGHVEQLRRWLPLMYPGITSAPVLEDVPLLAAGRGTPDDQAAAALAAALRGVRGEEVLPAAEVVLRAAVPGAASPAATLAALASLIFSDNLGNAAVWCDALLASIGERYGVVWNALFSAARAEIHHRLGDLANAKRQAHAALALMPRESWGVAVVVPLAVLIGVTTAMGDMEEAESHLDYPIPSAAFGTLGGVFYLISRGHFHLARGCDDAALQDFLAGGHLLKIWGVDCPSAVSWRLHAARAYLRKGLAAEAKDLVVEQHTMLRSGDSRTRGLTYRALAATLRLDERPPVLLKAADILDRCGDSLNLAYTLADLGRVHELLGDVAEARCHTERARRLAERSAAAPLSEPPPAPSGAGEGAEPLGVSALPVSRLSSAEWRVAELAAQGSTNEQIARQLYITVSTVEQHLTRSYRKLGIRRRTQLPSRLSGLAR